MNTRELIEQWPRFTDDQRQALLQAVSTRGKFKGYLLSSSPSLTKSPGVSQVDKWAAWQALVGLVAPARVSMRSIIFASEKERFLELENATDSLDFRFCLNACEPGYRWNTWTHRYDRVRALSLFASYINGGKV